MRRAVRPIAAVLFWLAVWQFAAWSVDKDFLLASPVAVVARLAHLISTVDFWGTVGWSLGRIVAGFLLAALVGVLTAAAAVRFRAVDVLFRGEHR